MTAALVLTKVAVAKAPGFARGQLPPLQGLKLGLNVVWGPNGIGKSTLARAMKGLVWRSTETHTEACAEAETADQTWRLERSGATLTQVCLADHRDADGLWGSFADADRYWFPLHDLLDRNNRGQDFQREILKEMQDGVDLDRACAEAGGDARPLAPQSLVFITLNKAVKTHRELGTEHARQRYLRDELAKAEARLAQAGAAGQQLEDNRKVQAYLKAQVRLADAHVAFAQWPQALERLAAEDPIRLGELEARQESLRLELEALAEAKQGRAAELAALKVAPELLSDGVLKKRLQDGRERLQVLEPALVQAKAALAAAQARERAWRDEFQWLLPEPPERPLLQSMLTRLQGLALRCEPLRCGLAVAEQRVSALGDPEPAAAQDTPQTWMALQEHLKAWQRHGLQACVPAPAPVLAPRRVAQALVAAAALAALLAGATLLWRPEAVLAGLLIPGLLWFLLRPEAVPEAPEVAQAKVSAEEARRQAAALLAPFPELLEGAEGLSPWTPQRVLELQAQATLRLGRTETRALRNGDRDRARAAALQARAEYASWLKDFETAGTQLGLRPGEPALQEAPFFHFAQGLLEWVQRLEAFAVARADVQAKSSELLEAQAGLGELLAALGAMAAATTVDDLPAHAQVLLDRREAALLLAGQLQTLDQQLAQKREERDRTTVELQQFWTVRAFAAPDRPGLEVLAAQVELRKEAAREVRQAEAELQAQADPAVAAAAQATTPEALEAAAQLLREEAATCQALSDHLVALRVKYEGLVKGEALAKAMDEELRARAALQEAQRRTTLNQVVHLLAQELKDNTLLAEQPAVLRGASARLRQFTAGRYELGVSSEQGFYAWDTVQSRIVPLDELSSGTRVQVLFAVRLAFIELKEAGGLKLPLFLDEVLANSDDDRAHAMIQALLEIAKERQVFYFTAQADEVAKLLGVAGPGHLAEFPLHRLALDQERAQVPLQPLPLAPFAPPEPLADYDAYGQACQAPGAELFTAVEALHAWHLFSRSEELHFFLARGGQRAGQLLASSLPQAEPLRKRLEMLRRAQTLAQQGRGRPFHLADLAEARLAGVSTTAEYWTGITEAAVAAAGDGVAFAKALALVPRSAKARGIIEPWLLEQGYLSAAQPLTVPEILLSLFEAFGQLDPGSEDRQVLERYLRSIIRP